MVMEWIKDWFVKNSASGEVINEGSNYLEEGWIDSFGFLGLIGDCEEHFSMVFADDDFADDKIFTIVGLCEIISQKVK